MTSPPTTSRWGRSMLPRTRLPRMAGLCAVLLLVSGCWTSNLFGGTSTVPSTTVSVFKVEIGQCFNPPPGTPTENLSDLTAIPCTTPHNQEAYAALIYKAPVGGDDSVYPGNDALASFANGSCAQAFQGYVGVSYLDSSLFFTYLLPSARSWESDNDRTVLCFTTTTGKPLVVSVKGSKM